MDDLSRLRDILPFAVALYLLASTVQLQATQHTPQYVGSSITVKEVLSRVKWHMLQVARNERNENLVFYPGN